MDQNALAGKLVTYFATAGKSLLFPGLMPFTLCGSDVYARRPTLPHLATCGLYVLLHLASQQRALSTLVQSRKIKASSVQFQET